MKRIVAVILTVSICFLITSCNTVEQTPSKTDIASISNTTSKNASSLNNYVVSSNADYLYVTSKENTTVNTITSSLSSNNIKNENTVLEDSYKNIKCATTAGCKELRILPTGCKAHLILPFPQEWKIEKNSQGFSIIKNSKKIGTITENYNLSGEVKHEEEYSSSGVGSNHFITKTATNQYNHIIIYSYKAVNDKDAIITLSVPYSELDDDTVYDMASKMSLDSSIGISNIGAMPFTDSRKKILILGNSFIASSRIGTILQQMCGSEAVVEAQSRGYASVSSYNQDANLINRIKSGEFSAVFMCGFYGYDNIQCFETFVDACNTSNTNLAIFPAHNEGSESVYFAKLTFPHVLLVDWKNEIDQLIKTGISRSEFCSNDSYGHSTPLAGYVGAHMIYRAIFGKVPAVKNFSEVSLNQINLLGSYANTGLINSSVKDEYVIYKF